LHSLLKVWDAQSDYAPRPQYTITISQETETSRGCEVLKQMRRVEEIDARIGKWDAISQVVVYKTVGVKAPSILPRVKEPV
jgi:hypothetical protein